MRINLTRIVGISVLALGISVAGMPVRAAIAAQDQNRTDQTHEDYSKNKNYQLGMKEGRDDRAHNRDHSKKHHFKNDEDQKAYDAGYQAGYGADQPDHH